MLASTTLLTTSAISIVLGVFASKSFLKSNRRIGDTAATSLSAALHFVPQFWLGLIFYIVFADQLYIFPINLADALTALGAHNYTGIAYYLRYAWAFTLPIIMLSIVGFGHRQQVLRNTMIEEYTVRDTWSTRKQEA